MTVLCGVIIGAFLSNSQTQQQSSDIAPIIHLQIESTIIDLDWNFDSSLLAFVSGDDLVSVINIETGIIELHLGNPEDEIYIVKEAAWSPTQNYLLIANNKTKIWDYSQGIWLDEFDFPNAIEFEAYTIEGNVDWHPDGERFAAVLRECPIRKLYRPGARVEIWDMATNSSAQIADCVWTDSDAVKWNPQGTQVAMSGFASFDEEGFVDDEEIQIWNVNQPEKVLTINDLKDPSGLEWSPGGDMIAFTTVIRVDQFMQVRNVTDGELVSQQKVNLAVYVPLDWHPSANFIATGGQDGSVKIWDALTGLLLVELFAHSDTVNDVGWSPNGSMLASVGRDGSLFVWRISDLIEQIQ